MHDLASDWVFDAIVLQLLRHRRTAGRVTESQQQTRNPMRIALVKRRYSLKVGGAERYCVNLSRRLAGVRT